MKIVEAKYDNGISTSIVKLDNSENECLMGSLVVKGGSSNDTEFKGSDIGGCNGI